jgi:hypothetical protein
MEMTANQGGQPCNIATNSSNRPASALTPAVLLSAESFL